MQSLETIRQRRSIRKYTGQAVSEEHIQLLLEAAMYAPTARNTQAWHYYVIERRELLDQLAEVHPYGKMLKDAPLAILVCADQKLELTGGYHAVNCSAATQNLLLAAHDLGLGAVWLGVYPRDTRMVDIAQLLELPASHIPINLISIGHPAEEKDIPQRFDATKVSRIR